MVIDNSLHSSASLSIMPIRHKPHKWLLYLAIFGTVAYAIAVPALMHLHNDFAALGWGLASIFALIWSLLLWKENKWLRMEDVSHVQDDPFGPRTAVPPFAHKERSNQPLLNNIPVAAPFYISTPMLAFAVLSTLGSLGASIYFFAIAGINHESLDGSSHWLAGISFLAATKVAVNVWVRVVKVRHTYQHVVAYLREAFTPLP